MERLTTDKPVGEMGMVELAHNSCYSEEGCARYRDFEKDIDARDFARKLMVAYGLWQDNVNCDMSIDSELFFDEDFDEAMLENLVYEPTDIKGLIALFYRNLWAQADLRECLKAYEDTGITPEQIREIDRLYREKCEEVAKYKALEERLENMFGRKFPLETVVDDLELALTEPDSPHPTNARILTHTESAEWEEYLRLKKKDCC